MGLMAVSALSVKIGVASALLVQPAAAFMSFLFRLRGIELTGSGARRRSDSPGGEFLVRLFLAFFVLNIWGLFFGKVAGPFKNHFLVLCCFATQMFPR